MMILQELLVLKEAADAADMTALEAKLLDLVLPKLKRFIEDGDDIEQFVDGGSDNDYLYDAWGTLVKGDAWGAEHSKLEKKLSKMSVKAWREAFKAKYGTTDREMLLKQEEEGLKKLSPDELKLMKHFGEYTTERFGMRDLDAKNEYHLRIYMKSPTKIVITSPTVNGMFFTDESLKKFNMSIEKIVAMFGRFGIKLGKRPVNKRRPSYSLYDSVVRGGKLVEAKAKGVPGKAAKPDFLKNDDSPMGQLEQLPQPIGINGGSYTYWVDVTKTPLKFVASDGSEVDKAKTLEDIADWMDKWAAEIWLEFLNGDEDLQHLRDEGIVRSKNGDRDQREHERLMRETK